MTFKYWNIFSIFCYRTNDLRFRSWNGRSSPTHVPKKFVKVQKNGPKSSLKKFVQKNSSKSKKFVKKFVKKVRQKKLVKTCVTIFIEIYWNIFSIFVTEQMTCDSDPEMGGAVQLIFGHFWPFFTIQSQLTKTLLFYIETFSPFLLQNKWLAI